MAGEILSSMKYTGAVSAARSDTMCRGWRYTSSLKLFISSDRMTCRGQQRGSDGDYVVKDDFELTNKYPPPLLSQQCLMNGYESSNLRFCYISTKCK